MREGNQESVHYFAEEAAVRAFSDENADLHLFGAPSMDSTGRACQDGADGGCRHGNGRRQRGCRARRQGAIRPPGDGWWSFTSRSAIQRLIDDLAAKGLHIEHYAAQDQPLFELLEGEGDRSVAHPVFSMPEILERIKEHGRKGVQIKRFKGWGK